MCNETILKQTKTKRLTNALRNNGLRLNGQANGFMQGIDENLDPLEEFKTSAQRLSLVPEKIFSDFFKNLLPVGRLH